MLSDSRLGVSLSTLLGAAPLLGGPLEDRSGVRRRQDAAVVAHAWQDSHREVPAAVLQGFCAAPLDFLVTSAHGQREVRLIELNGSGMGGLTNLPLDVISALLASLGEVAGALAERGPSVVLVSASGGPPCSARGANPLLHEKLLYVDALRASLGSRGREARVTTQEGLKRAPAPPPSSQETSLVLGFSTELGEAIDVRSDGAWLYGRRIVGIVNDRLCLDVWRRTGEGGPPPFVPVNRSFVAGADKGIAYDVLDGLALGPGSAFPSLRAAGRHRRAGSRHELVRELAMLLAAQATPLLIKPRGTGQGDGIEFFLDRTASRREIEATVDRSLAAVGARYGSVERAFPYTICELIDAAVIPDRDHPCCGHKFELRIVVFREGEGLRACPAIAKIASERWDPARPTRPMLVNNVTYSAKLLGRPGHDFMLPLCNHDTLASLGVDLDLLHETCRFATAYVEAALRSPAACGGVSAPAGA